VSYPPGFPAHLYQYHPVVGSQYELPQHLQRDGQQHTYFATAPPQPGQSNFAPVPPIKPPTTQTVEDFLAQHEQEQREKEATKAVRVQDTVDETSTSPNFVDLDDEITEEDMEEDDDDMQEDPEEPDCVPNTGCKYGPVPTKFELKNKSKSKFPIFYNPIILIIKIISLQFF